METVKESVEKQFSRTAAAYRVSSVHAGGIDLERLVALAALSGSEVVLDAGCGAGHTAAALAPGARQVIALDLSERMLAVTVQLAADRGLTNLATRQGDVEALPFDDGIFDLVVSRYSAHHWPHPQAALGEIRRVLKPGGRFLLDDIVSVDDFVVDTHLQAMELLRDPSHVRDHSPAQWLAMLRAAGFAAEVDFNFPCRLNFADWAQRMAMPAPAAALLRERMIAAPVEVRTAFAIESTGEHFTIPGALITARKQVQSSHDRLIDGQAPR